MCGTKTENIFRIRCHIFFHNGAQHSIILEFDILWCCFPLLLCFYLFIYVISFSRFISTVCVWERSVVCALISGQFDAICFNLRRFWCVVVVSAVAISICCNYAKTFKLHQFSSRIKCVHIHTRLHNVWIEEHLRVWHIQHENNNITRKKFGYVSIVIYVDRSYFITSNMLRVCICSILKTYGVYMYGVLPFLVRNAICRSCCFLAFIDVVVVVVVVVIMALSLYP